MANKENEVKTELESIENCIFCSAPIKRKRDTFSGMVFNITCPCVIEKKEKEKIESIQRGTVKLRSSMREWTGIKRRFNNVSLKSIVPRGEQTQPYNEAMSFIKDFSNDKNTNGLIFAGGVGSGKTYLAVGIANDIIDSYKISDYEAIKADEGNTYNKYTPVQFISTIELFSELKGSFDGTDKSSNTKELIDKYKTAELLILDDLGAEKTSEWVNERLFEIIDYRYGELLPIIITTNCNPNELKAKIGNRSFDRLKEMSKLVSVDLDSQRVIA